MGANEELIRNECLERLRMLHIEGAEGFSLHERVLWSGGRNDAEAPRPYEDMDKIRAFEKHFEASAYYVIRAKTRMGEEDAILFVSHDSDAWAAEQEDLLFGEADAFILEREEPLRNGVRRIGIAPTQRGGLWRHF